MPINPSLNVGLVFDDSLDSDDGVAQNVKALGAWLASRGHNVSYLVGETKLKSWAGGQVYSLSKNIAVRFNGNKLSMPLLARKSVIKPVLATNNYDVLHITVPYSPLMGARVIKMAEAKTAVVGTFHILPAGIVSRAGSRVLGFLSKPSLKRIVELVSTSRPAAVFAEQSYRIAGGVIPNPVDLAKFEPKNQSWGKAGDAKIVFLGRLVKRKGAAQLVEAYAQLAANGSPAKLVIAGDGPERPKLEARVKSLGLSERVKFLGHIDETAKPALLASANVACFPSLYGESFGIVLVEAMASGSKTILAGDNPGYRSVMSGQPMTLIDPTITSAFAERLAKLLSDDDLAKQIQDWQKQQVGQYDIKVVGAQVEALYKRAIARTAKISHNNSYGIQKSND